MILLLNILLVFLQGQSTLDILLTDYLNAELSEYHKVEYTVLNAPDKYDLIKIDDDRDFKLSKAKAYVPVVIKVNGDLRKSYVTLKVKLFQNVLVARTKIDKNTDINATDVKFMLADVAGLRGDFYTNPFDLAHYRTKYKIKKEEIITDYLTKPIPVINRGDKIKATVISGKVKISTDAIAKQSGAINDKIRIVTLDNKYFTAKITGPNEVLIIE